MFNESSIQFTEWNSKNFFFDQIIFVICLLATISHFSLWIQLILHKAKFDVSFMFSVGYIAQDPLLLLCYYINYSIRIRSSLHVKRSFCYFEAYSIFIFNLLQSYDLALLNICRYYQIVRNQNVYKRYRQIVIPVSIIIPLFILSNLYIQYKFGWSVVIDRPGISCSLSYTNNLVRIWNFIIVLLLPIAIGFYMLVRALHFLRSYHAQQTMIQRNHHRHLIVHSLIFYSAWFVLWVPLILVIFFDIDDMNEDVGFAALVASTLEVFVDPFLAYFLDKRFARAWKKSLQWSKQKFMCHTNTRTYPIVQQPVHFRRDTQIDANMWRY